MRLLAISPLIPSPVLAATKPPEPLKPPVPPPHAGQSRALVSQATPQTLALFQSEHEPASILQRVQREEVLATRDAGEIIQNTIAAFDRWQEADSDAAMKLTEQQDEEFYLATLPPPEAPWRRTARQLRPWLAPTGLIIAGVAAGLAVPGYFISLSLLGVALALQRLYKRVKANRLDERERVAAAQDYTHARYYHEAFTYVVENKLYRQKNIRLAIFKLFTDMSVDGLYQEARGSGRPPPPPPPGRPKVEEPWAQPSPQWAAIRTLFDLVRKWGNWHAVYAIQRLDQEGILYMPPNYRLASIKDSPVLIDRALHGMSRGVSRSLEACHLLCQHNEEFRTKFEQACREAGKSHLYRM